MGLFSADSTDLKVGEQLLGLIAQRFNSIVGYAYSVEITPSMKPLEQCCQAFKRVTERGFPADPGPFKRLAGFSVLSQEFFPFEVKVNARPEALDGEIIWAPRIAVWALPIFASSLRVNARGPFVESFILPTPHFQVEFISYLRNMANGRKATNAAASDFLLLERITAAGLILEAAAYIPPDFHTNLAALLAGADGCMEQILSDFVLAEDVRFNDRKFLDLTLGGIGCEN